MDRTVEVSAMPARLLDLSAAAAYLGGVSVWTLRALVAKGELTPVRLPSVRRKDQQGRRLLFDREDLDAAVAKWKAGQA
jgi:hypothetical protein